MTKPSTDLEFMLIATDDINTSTTLDTKLASSNSCETFPKHLENYLCVFSYISIKKSRISPLKALSDENPWPIKT